jgi:glutamyl-tRNA reductase
MEKLEGIFVYNIDDLQKVANENRAGRSQEAQDAEAIVDREVERYQQARQALDAVPAIVAVQSTLEHLRQQELTRHAAHLAALDPRARLAVEEMSRSLMHKVLHGPLVALKDAAREGDVERMRSIRAAFTGDGAGPNEDKLD